MRTLGLLSPFSGRNHEFYLRALHEDVRLRSGHVQDAKLIAMGFNPSTRLLVEEKWWTLVQQIKNHIRELAAAGAEAVLLTSLVWYRFAEEFSNSSEIPVLHPVDALVQGLPAPGLESRPLGFIAPELVTLECGLVERFRLGFQREILLASAPTGVIAAESGDSTSNTGSVALRRQLQTIIDGLRMAGAAGIIVGTPELAGLISPEEFARDCFHLPALQVAFAGEWMLHRSHESLF